MAREWKGEWTGLEGAKMRAAYVREPRRGFRNSD
jgi:hypothetical protein